MTLNDYSVLQLALQKQAWTEESETHKTQQTAPSDADLQLHTDRNAGFLQDWVTHAFMTVTHLGS